MENSGGDNPGRQQALRSPDTLQVFLIALTVVFFGLTVYSVIQENPSFFHFSDTGLFSIKIFGTEPSATLFITALGALLVRNQFALSLQPRISYKSDLNNPGGTWQVSIKNAGLGAAIINRASFDLEMPLQNISLTGVALDVVLKELAKAGLERETDYRLANISEGFTLPPQKEYTAFEIKPGHIAKIKRLNMVLHFQGFLGDKYFRNVVLMPKGLTKT